MRGGRRETGIALLFLSPALVGFIVFFLWPTLRGFYLSLTEYSLLQPPEFIGLGNYQELVKDPQFWNSLKVTFEYVVINIGLQTTLALGLAVLLHRLTASTLLRGVVLLPYLIANVVVALLWFWMADYNLGVLNQALGWLHIGPIAFFGDANMAIPTIAFVNVWRHLGYTSLLIFAGLQTIPKDVYEAASMDGANEWQTFKNVIFPTLRPTNTIVLVVTIIESLRAFDLVYVFNGGAQGTELLSILVTNNIIGESSRIGYGSAIAVVLLVISLAVIIPYLISTFRKERSA
jgi:multiple sugar transport system permease protein